MSRLFFSKHLQASIGAFLLACIVPAGRCDAAVISTFDLTAENWTMVSFSDIFANNFTVSNTYSPTYHASGGNPIGYISADDQGSDDFTFSAPAKFLGNDAAATGLTYDLTHPVGNVDYQTTDVILLGASSRLLWKSSPDLALGTG